MKTKRQIEVLAAKKKTKTMPSVSKGFDMKSDHILKIPCVYDQIPVTFKWVFYLIFYQIIINTIWNLGKTHAKFVNIFSRNVMSYFYSQDTIIALIVTYILKLESECMHVVFLYVCVCMCTYVKSFVI